VQAASKSVVLIVVRDATGKEIAQGSGFVVTTDGKIVTNYHVIEGGESAVVKFSSGAFFEVAGVLAVDSSRDLALLQATGQDFSPLPLGDSDRVQVGEQVVAIGSPLALEATVSNGIISAIRGSTLDASLTLLQTTAPVSPGSSGGALLNMQGQVVGVTAFQASGQNLNFAVPVNYVIPLIVERSVKPLSTVSAPPERESAAPTTLADLEGTYLGTWQSNLGYSGVAALTIAVSGSGLSGKVVLTGSPVGYTGDSVWMTVSKLGDGVWAVQFKGDRSNLSGTGIFRGRSFVGDYRYVRVLLGVDDRGQWILKK